MSEKEFTYKATDERDEITKLREQLARKEAEAAKNEQFGKYDVTAPNEGEDTYQSYLEQRPSDGVIRDGEKYRNATSGQFASEDEYLSDKSAQATDDYYYQQMEAGAEAPVEADYNSMGLKQLVVAMARAEKLGDRAESMDIQAVMSAKLDKQAADQGWTAEEKEEQADILLAQVMRLSEQKQSSEQSVSTEPTEAEVSAPNEEPAVAADIDKTEVIDVNPLITEHAQPAKEGESKEEYEERAAEANKVNELNDLVVESTPTEPVNTLEGLTVVEASADKPEDLVDKSDAEKQKESIWKRAANRSRDLYLKAGMLFGKGVGTAYTGVRRFDERHLTPKVKAGETNEEYEKRCKRVRAVKALGLVALGAGIATAVWGLHEVLEGHGDATQALAGPTGHHPGIFEGNGPTNHHLGVDSLGTSGSADTDGNTMPVGQHSGPEVFSAGAHHVTAGEGWDHTFDQMNIPKSEQPALLHKLLDTDDPSIKEWVYKMQNGDPGISHTGDITTNVLESINKLR